MQTMSLVLPAATPEPESLRLIGGSDPFTDLLSTAVVQAVLLQSTAATLQRIPASVSLIRYSAYQLALVQVVMFAPDAELTAKAGLISSTNYPVVTEEWKALTGPLSGYLEAEGTDEKKLDVGMAKLAQRVVRIHNSIQTEGSHSQLIERDVLPLIDLYKRLATDAATAGEVTDALDSLLKQQGADFAKLFHYQRQIQQFTSEVADIVADLPRGRSGGMEEPPPADITSTSVESSSAPSSSLGAPSSSSSSSVALATPRKRKTATKKGSEVESKRGEVESKRGEEPKRGLAPTDWFAKHEAALVEYIGDFYGPVSIVSVGTEPEIVEPETESVEILEAAASTTTSLTAPLDDPNAMVDDFAEEVEEKRVLQDATLAVLPEDPDTKMMPENEQTVYQDLEDAIQFDKETSTAFMAETFHISMGKITGWVNHLETKYGKKLLISND